MTIPSMSSTGAYATSGTEKGFLISRGEEVCDVAQNKVVGQAVKCDPRSSQKYGGCGMVRRVASQQPGYNETHW